ncbi:MAG TPA: 3'-5' exonuclease, partial [Reyranella sp.]|nr:3'-5' exonuclease [Reyranella sp.]
MNAYIAARSAIDAGSRIKITANFRSVEPILAFVNKRFEPVLSADGQPGFSELSPIHPAIGSKPGVCALEVVVEGEKPKAAAIRDGEALAVADLCNRLVGNLQVRDHHTGEMRACRFGDIALLAPVSTELWRFEEALEELAIPVSTQAGKGFFRRQEIQDLIALTRSLADPRDTLAFGALLRGPLVGLTETELLDISEALPVDPARRGLPMLTLRTDPASVNHALAKDVLTKLSSLRRRARTTTPYALLADAIAVLHVRPQIRQRFKAGAERAVANVDLFLEMARAYDVRGLRAFASDMRANWDEAVRQVEGRPDAEQEAVSLITVHAAKGLEWPVVIPINM